MLHINSISLHPDENVGWERVRAVEPITSAWENLRGEIGVGDVGDGGNLGIDNHAIPEDGGGESLI
jgi:hypothetical protein